MRRPTVRWHSALLHPMRRWNTATLSSRNHRAPLSSFTFPFVDAARQMRLERAAGRCHVRGAVRARA
eukprot:2164735-Pyramimonas_sp.AAC.1